MNNLSNNLPASKVGCAFLIVITSDFRMGKHKDDDHEDDASYFRMFRIHSTKENFESDIPSCHKIEIRIQTRSQVYGNIQKIICSQERQKSIDVCCTGGAKYQFDFYGNWSRSRFFDEFKINYLKSHRSGFHGRPYTAYPYSFLSDLYFKTRTFDFVRQNVDFFHKSLDPKKSNSSSFLSRSFDTLVKCNWRHTQD